jgi:hypothetical protein
MPEPQEIPQIVTDLFTMSRDYLRQETVEPAKRLGRAAGMGIGAGAIFAVAAMFGGLGFYALYRQVLPEGDWWVVLARGLTTLSCLAVAGTIGWRISRK